MELFVEHGSSTTVDEPTHSANDLQLFVNLPSGSADGSADGQPLCVAARPSDSVRALQRRLARVCGVVPGEQVVTMAGMPLRTTCTSGGASRSLTLQDCGVNNGCTLDISLRLQGGAKKKKGGRSKSKGKKGKKGRSKSKGKKGKKGKKGSAAEDAGPGCQNQLDDALSELEANVSDTSALDALQRVEEVAAGDLLKNWNPADTSVVGAMFERFCELLDREASTASATASDGVEGRADGAGGNGTGVPGARGSADADARVEAALPSVAESAVNAKSKPLSQHVRTRLAAVAATLIEAGHEKVADYKKNGPAGAGGAEDGKGKAGKKGKKKKAKKAGKKKKGKGKGKGDAKDDGPPPLVKAATADLEVMLVMQSTALYPRALRTLSAITASDLAPGQAWAPANNEGTSDGASDGSPQAAASSEAAGAGAALRQTCDAAVTALGRVKQRVFDMLTPPDASRKRKAEPVDPSSICVRFHAMRFLKEVALVCTTAVSPELPSVDQARQPAQPAQAGPGARRHATRRSSRATVGNEFTENDVQEAANLAARMRRVQGGGPGGAGAGARAGTFSVDLVPDHHPIVNRDDVLADGKMAVQILCDRAPQMAGGDSRPFAPEVLQADATATKRQRDLSEKARTVPFSTTLYVGAMEDLSDLATQRPLARPAVLPALMRMQATEVPHLDMYTSTKLNIQQLALEEEEVGRKLRERAAAEQEQQRRRTRW